MAIAILYPYSTILQKMTDFRNGICRKISLSQDMVERDI
jgi:hypothetical protein